MAKIYTPIDYIMVPASKPHPGNTKYKISIGFENWGEDKPEYVLKIQMVYDGLVSGRKSPSYPVGTDDYKRVMNAVEEILSKNMLL